MNSTMKKTMIASSVALAIGSVNAQAALVTNVFGPAAAFVTDSANFTMLGNNGGVVGGTNDVKMVWNNTAYTSSTDYTGPGSVSNVTASSSALFFNHNWTAHDIQVFTPGSYTFDVTLGSGNNEGLGTNSSAQFMNVTVGTGQMGMHMLFDWNGNANIDVFVVASATGSVFGSGLLYSTTKTTGGAFKCDVAFTGTIVKNCLYDGALFGSAGVPTKNEIWMLASTDGNGDGIMGIPMAAGGPFGGFNANFNANLTAVPVPAAAWLFGSGLLGLVGIARRKKKNSA